MRRLSPLASCLFLLAVALCAASLWARPAGAQSAKPTRQSKARLPIADQRDSGVSRQDLLSPYSALQREQMGPPRELASESAQEGESVQTNATSWKLDPGLNPKKEEGGPVRLKFGQDKQVDPVTGKDMSKKADPAGAANKLKDLDVKGAAEKMGGKAGVEVDVFKF